MNKKAAPMFGNIESELDLGYKKILDLRKANDVEDNLTKKYNMRSSQVFKSNCKLNKKEEDTSEKLKFSCKTVSDESGSIENCKASTKGAKDAKKQSLNKSIMDIKEQKGKFETKLFNFYKDYDSQNLLSNIEEHRQLIEKKCCEVNTINNVEESCKEKGKVIFDQNILNYLYNFLFTEHNNILPENLLKKRGNRDLIIKCLQNKTTIQEFSENSTQKSEYNL